MRILVIAVLLALGLCISATCAGAYPVIVVTACDTLSTEPLRVRTTFDMSQQGPPPGYGEILLGPSAPGQEAGDPTQILDAGVPAGWGMLSYPGEAWRVFWPDEDHQDAWWAGERAVGFWIVTNEAPPCVYFIFTNAVMDVFPIDACLRCDMAVPARPATWGGVKALYR